MKKIYSEILFSILQLIVGILLLIDPVGFTKGIIVVLGIFILLMGISFVVRYFRLPIDFVKKENLLFKGLLGLLVGWIFTFNSNWFIVAFPLITILYGIIILITGLNKVQISVDLIRLKKKGRILNIINAIVTLIFSTIVILNPFSTTTALWIFTGISLIVDAIFDIIVVIIENSNNRNVGKEDEKADIIM